MKHAAAAWACLAGLGLCVWWLVHPPPWQGRATWYVLMAGAWVLFACAVWLIRKAPRKAAIWLIVAGAVGLPLAAGFAPPRTSDDLYRYLWDGRVQAEGINPYQHPPAARELSDLRDDFLWPQQSAWCVDADEPGAAPGCSLINRPTVHTIYPPVAQLYFLAVHGLSPPGSREGPIQFAAALVVVAVTILLLTVLPKAGCDPRTAALWAWCPLVALEAGNNAHLDVLSTLLTVAALLAAALAKTWRGTAGGAALLGLAIATKLTPALASPSLVRRRPLTVIAAATLTMALFYLPYLISTDKSVLGYLPHYLTGEGYASGGRFALLALVFPAPVRLAAALTILAVTAAVVWRRTDPDRPWNTAVVMTGVFLLIATPGYSWYAILLVALAAMNDRPEWISVGVAGYVAQYADNLHLDRYPALKLGYGAALIVVFAVTMLRRHRIRKTMRARNLCSNTNQWPHAI